VKVYKTLRQCWLFTGWFARKGSGLKQVLVLLTEVFKSAGGIQMVGRCICKALSQIAADRSLMVDVLCLNDGDDFDSRYVDDKFLSYRGFDGNRRKFVIKALRIGLFYDVSFVVIGHVGLSPIGLVLKMFRDSPYYVFVYGIEAWVTLPRLKRRALQKANKSISISSFTREQLCTKNSVPPEQVTVLQLCLNPYWVETTTLSLADSPSLQAPVLLTVGRLSSQEQYKGQDKVIQALPQVAQEIPEVKYVVVGTGDDLPRLQDLAQKTGVAQHVYFAGFVSDAELHQLYEQCALFVLPSKGEGFGIVCLEAMYHRKPVVASNRGALPEVVVAGETGLLVEPDDIEALAQAIIRLLKNTTERTQMGEAGYRLVQKQFTFERFCADFEQLLK